MVPWSDTGPLAFRTSGDLIFTGFVIGFFVCFLFCWFLEIRLASNSEIRLPLPPGLKACATTAWLVVLLMMYMHVLTH